MNKNDLNISDLEKYTFSKYLDGIHGLENFSQINSFTNNFIVNYNPLNPVHNFNRENQNIPTLYIVASNVFGGVHVKN